jgi:hypothetical protein
MPKIENASNLDNLLHRLKTLDPDAYRDIEEFYLVRNVADGVDYVSDEWGHHASLSVPDKWLEYVVQGVVQQAIADHRGIDHTEDWFFEMENEDKNQYVAKVWNRVVKLGEAEGRTPAIALLGAYLEAIECDKAFHKAFEEEGLMCAIDAVKGE